VHSYALAEAAAAAQLAMDPRSFRGIEDWGARLLGATGSDWSQVKAGSRAQSKSQWCATRSHMVRGLWTHRRTRDCLPPARERDLSDRA
jgi:hypothetical protein